MIEEIFRVLLFSLVIEPPANHGIPCTMPLRETRFPRNSIREDIQTQRPHANMSSTGELRNLGPIDRV